MKQFFYALLISLLVASVHAQELSADEITANMKAAGESLQDASFVVTGSLIDPDGTEIPLEVVTQVIPGVKAARAEFIQPDALADNFIVLNDEAVYNYTFLTNQATIFTTQDPDALGGLFPEGNVDEGFDFTLDPNQLLRGWEAEVQGYSESPVGNVYEMRFFNQEENAVVSYVNATIVDGAWYPYTLAFYDAEDTELISLTVQDYAQDQGLDADEVTYIPDDAELIDER